MAESQVSESDKSSNIFSGSNKKSVHHHPLLIGGGLILLVLATILLTLSLAPRKESVSNQPKPVKYSETVTPTAYGSFLSVALESFYSGGNTNGVDIPGHKYYPSTADLKDLDWAQKNVQLDAHMFSLITDGKVIYSPKGCDANRPSSAQNMCKSFIVTADGKEVEKSRN